MLYVFIGATLVWRQKRERESDDVSFTSYTEKARISLLQPNVLKKTFLTLSEMARLELTRPFFMPCGWSAFFGIVGPATLTNCIVEYSTPSKKTHTPFFFHRVSRRVHHGFHLIE